MKKTTKKPKVSIVVPIYNVEKFLHQSVDSILDQTLKDIEIILVDDGSLDRCGKICDEYTKKDSRIRVIHQKNAGLGNAYNNGIAIAKGEYIGFVEPDDWIEPEMYEILYNNAKRYDTDATKCDFYIYNSVAPNVNSVPNYGFIRSEPRGPFKIEDYELLCAYHSSIWTYIYKSDFVKKIKFVETSGAGYVDAPFGFEVLCKAKRLSMVPYAFYHWRVENHGNSVSLVDRRAMAMADRFIESKNILKKTGKYDKLKEVFYLHAKNANKSMYDNINKKYKREYFDKLRELFSDLKTDKNFQWKYFDSTSKKWVQHINNNHFLSWDIWHIIKNFLLDFKIRKNSFIIQILGIQISKGEFSKKPAILKKVIK